MTQSYVFYETADPLPIVWGAVDFCNDALPKEAIPGNSRRKIPHLKRGFEIFPAVKITRLGIQRKQQKCGIGTALLTVIKHFFWKTTVPAAGSSPSMLTAEQFHSTKRTASPGRSRQKMKIRTPPQSLYSSISHESSADHSGHRLPQIILQKIKKFLNPP